MKIRRTGSLRKLIGALLGATLLVALSGCYPYYWGPHGYGHGQYERGGHHGGGYHHDRNDRRHRDRHHGYRRY